MLYQSPPDKPYLDPDIKVNGERLKAVHKITYLGSTLSRNVAIDGEVQCILAKASSAFLRLSKQVWNRRGIRFEIKLKVYRASVITTLLY